MRSERYEHGETRVHVVRSTKTRGMNSQTTLIVGIGSDHGDDRVGWRVARRLDQRNDRALSVRLARVPADLLDWLGGFDRLVVCDAFVGERPTPLIQHWRWPADVLSRAGWRNSHGLGLPDALDLAERLGQLPTHVDIWGIRIESAGPVDGVSAAAEMAIGHAVARIEADLVSGVERNA